MECQDTQPTDAFTLAAQKAAAKRRDSQDAVGGDLVTWWVTT